ncbi:MAG: diaminopimelate decarboxylase [Gammaproteobacteria bacterium]|nr:diaminopimelate decarboxylase [Gammaproteobacteria bacterium]
MKAFDYQNDILCAGGIPVPEIVAKVGTPVYIYSAEHFRNQYKTLQDTLTSIDSEIFYSVKANSNLDVLALFKKLGAGFDIVSGGELQRTIAVGCDPKKVIFSGVGKLAEEIDLALKVGIGCFNVESGSELDRIIERAIILGKQAPISIRVNPNIDPRTHPYISTGLKENKFGVSTSQAMDLYRISKNNPHINIVGIDCHIGSQIMEVAPLEESLTNLLGLAETLRNEGIEVQHIDIGGGIGVRYRDEPAFDLKNYGEILQKKLAETGLRLLLEPGRFLVANGGVLITRVEYLKHAESENETNFAIVDGAMTDLLRPSLYNAWHNVQKVEQVNQKQAKQWDVVGAVCESSDFLAKKRVLSLVADDLLAIMSAGAYGIGLSSNYNSRPRPAEVLVDGGQFKIIRRRENTRDQLRLETYQAENN